MSYTILKAATLAIASLCIAGCSTSPSIIVHDDQHQVHDKSTVMLTVLLELAIDSNFEDTALTSSGPQLVAGDWLAWQCALAGSYWDMNQSNAPAYAEAHE